MKSTMLMQSDKTVVRKRRRLRFRFFRASSPAMPKRRRVSGEVFTVFRSILISELSRIASMGEVAAALLAGI